MIAYWHKTRNFGDTLTPIILKWITGETTLFASKNETGKTLAVGSIIYAIAENDVVWGTGAIGPEEIKVPEGAVMLAVRGPLTREVLGNQAPEVYGDPAILLPLIYNPDRPKRYKVGLLPHYVDKEIVEVNTGEKFIDILGNWQDVIDQVKECERIETSSLHGIIIAEAYGIPVTWKVYSDKIVGGDFKFQDYFLGTGRERQKPDSRIEPMKDLEQRQNLLIKILKEHHGKN